jgi:hypothetical protein
MVTTPVATPETSPPVETVAAVALLLQVPPGDASDKASVAPVQTVAAPEGVIAAGFALTVTVVVVKQEPIA